MFEEYERFSRSDSSLRRVIAGLKALAYPACFVIGLGFFPFYGLVSGTLWGRTIQTARSPKDSHKAVLLKKYNLADINYIVKVDGERVYISSDLMPFPDHLYRETLVWDETGRVVVLELMGKRVFAYDVVEKRPLRKGELEKYRLFPALDEYVYAELKDIDE